MVKQRKFGGSEFQTAGATLGKLRKPSFVLVMPNVEMQYNTVQKKIIEYPAEFLGIKSRIVSSLDERSSGIVDTGDE